MQLCNVYLLKYGETCLHWAAEQGHRDIIAQLLERGADPNLTNQVFVSGSIAFVHLYCAKITE